MIRPRHTVPRAAPRAEDDIGRPNLVASDNAAAALDACSICTYQRRGARGERLAAKGPELPLQVLACLKAQAFLHAGRQKGHTGLKGALEKGPTARLVHPRR